MKGQKYGEYREAWHLLVNASKARVEGPIDIRACCDADDAAAGTSAIRNMFRRVFQG